MIPGMSGRALPDVSRLALVPAEALRRFRARLSEIGLTEDYVAEITKLGDSQLGLLGRPLQNWHARRKREPAAYAARMLLLEDPVTADEAREALGTDLVDALTAGGLIVASADGRLVSPFELVVTERICLISDHLDEGSEDAVMGATSTTAILCQASLPERPVERMLDLGCGAGSCALLLTHRAATAVGTDVNARAIVLSRINAAMNEIGNVSFREGDLFAPVTGEQFDLIVSQPPWFAKPTDVDDRVYLFGGSRGDEISLRILRELPPYLNARGRAMLLVEWPVINGDPIEDRVADAVTQDDCNVLLLRFPPKELDDYCTRYAALENPRLGPDFERSVVHRREHLEKLGICGTMIALVVIQRNPDGLEWAGSVDVHAADTDWITAARIDRMIAARDLLAGDPTRLLATRLRVPEGTVFAREYKLGHPATPTVSARFPHEALVGNVQLGPGAQLLLTLLNEAPDAQSAIRRYAEGEKMSFEAAFGRLMPHLGESLLAGMLEPVTASS